MVPNKAALHTRGGEYSGWGDDSYLPRGGEILTPLERLTTTACQQGNECRLMLQCDLPLVWEYRHESKNEIGFGSNTQEPGNE